MHLKLLKKDTLFTLLKLVGATAIIYVWLTLYASPVGEKFDFLLPQYITEDLGGLDGLSTVDLPFDEFHQASLSTALSYIEDDFDEDEDASYKERYTMLCDMYEDLCDVVSFDGKFSSEEKYKYFASIAFTFLKMEKNIEYGYPLEDVLDSIRIKKDTGNRRGYATWDTVVINLGSVKSYNEFLELIGHELGHIVDLGVVNGESRKVHSSFTEFGKKVFSVDDPSLDYYKISWKSETVRKVGSKKEDFCSGYGMSDPFEDFAECHNLYLNHNDLFKYLAKKNVALKQKYTFMYNLYEGKYLFSSSKDLSKVKSSSSRRPWDTTRIQ